MKNYTFEKAFERLEEILKILNEKAISLEDSLKLFEEANFLITNCSSKLEDAEKKVEILIKKRGNLEMEGNLPKKENFSKEIFSFEDKRVLKEDG